MARVTPDLIMLYWTTPETTVGRAVMQKKSININTSVYIILSLIFWLIDYQCHHISKMVPLYFRLAIFETYKRKLKIPGVGKEQLKPFFLNHF